VDLVSDTICAYVVDQRTRRVTDAALHAATRRVLDSLACAVAAMDSVPARIVRGIAGEVSGVMSASVIGLARPSTMDLAAFANTVMIRYLDCNDTYFTARGGGGHPSDMIAAALAVGEATGATGYEVLRAIILGYEIHGALASAVWVREHGWDQGLNIIAAVTVMTGYLLHLSSEELRNALAMAVTAHVPVRQTRVGHLSMWKGTATAEAVRNGIFSAMLAARGMTGPPQPYVGRSGIWEQVTGRFEIDLPVRSDRAVIEDTTIKLRPAEFNAQAPLDVIFEMRDDVSLDLIEGIEVATYWLAWHEIGMDAAKWDPRSRETADHSLPYLLAVALVDGVIDVSSCTPARVADPSLRPLMRKIRVVERPEFTRRFPREFNVEISIRQRNTPTLVKRATYPHGHPRNPATDADLDAKLATLAFGGDAARRAACEQVSLLARGLADAANVKALMDPLTKLVPVADVTAAAAGVN
jgi:2-methylcitrate dehydratase